MDESFDRRRAPRVQLSEENPIPCQLCRPEHGPVMMGFLIDLSETGAAVRVEFPAEIELEPGDVVLLRTTLPESAAPCRFECTLRHIRPEENSWFLGFELTGAWSRSHFHILLARLKRFVSRFLGQREETSA